MTILDDDKLNMLLESLKLNDQERHNLARIKVHYFQVVELAHSPYEEKTHMESIQVESDIQIHHQDLEYEWLRLQKKDIKDRLESYLLMPWVETVGGNESVVIEEKAPKVHRDYQTDYMVVEEI